MPADIELRWSSQTPDGKSIWHTVWLDAASFLGKSQDEIVAAVFAAKPGDWKSGDTLGAIEAIRQRLPALEEAKRAEEAKIAAFHERMKREEAERIVAEHAAEHAAQERRAAEAKVRRDALVEKAEALAAASEERAREQRNEFEERIIERLMAKIEARR